MHDQVLAMSSHCDALDLSAAMPGVGGRAEGGGENKYPSCCCCYAGMYILRGQLQDQLLAEAPDVH